jgi:DNA-binding NarL/FixJ family response regulator
VQRVLIVDDHPNFRELASRVLASSGFAVVGEAADAAEALAAVQRLRPDVVLLDVVLPDRSGIAVARELATRSDGPLVVLISSRSRSDFGDSFEWPPRCSFLPKHQLSPTRLRNALRDL